MIKVASYNCQQSNARAVHFLSSTPNAEAVCTQESGMRMNLIGYIANTPNFMAANGFQNDSCAVVTQTSQRVAAQESIAIHAGANNNRSALLVKLRSGLVVINVHLTSGNARRAKEELALIYTHIESKYSANPWLIIGDFNHQPTTIDYPGVKIVSGPIHSGGQYLDWAMAGNVSSLIAGQYPRYHGSDHGPWFVEVS